MKTHRIAYHPVGKPTEIKYKCIGSTEELPGEGYAIIEYKSLKWPEITCEKCTCK